LERLTRDYKDFRELNSKARNSGSAQINKRTIKGKVVLEIRKEIFANRKETFMKIIVTDLLGHISKPLAKELVQKGYAVTFISS